MILVLASDTFYEEKNFISETEKVLVLGCFFWLSDESLTCNLINYTVRRCIDLRFHDGDLHL
jgi:hypothetical protein